MDRSVRSQAFVEEMWRWYVCHRRTLPWRDLKIEDDTQRAYMILVSEVMLQQTQVARVQVVFKQFIERFPTIEYLARASNRDVLIAWRGMGYNSRALRLRDAAKVIIKDFGGVFPREMDALLSIKGVGPYTAAAIRNFAFGIPTACVDVNIERILARVFGLKAKKGVGEKAGEVVRVVLEDQPANVSNRSAARWHSALMDFGSVVCTKRSPKCNQCPLSRGICRSAFTVDRATSNGQTSKREPGRLVGSRFIPNRIFRGKIVELLRDHPQGLTLESIGREICLDWSREHQTWLRDILRNLGRDLLLKNQGKKYILS